MSFLGNLIDQFGGGQEDAIASKLGLSAGQLREAVESLHRNAAQPGDTASQAAAETGIPLSTLQQVLEHVGGESQLGPFMGVLRAAENSSGGGLDGLVGGLRGWLGGGSGEATEAARKGGEETGTGEGGEG